MSNDNGAARTPDLSVFQGQSGPEGMGDKLPPQNLEAERGVLGGMLLEPARIPEVLAILQADDFYRDAHQVIFRAIVGLYEQGKGVDCVTLAEELTLRGQFQQIGGDETLLEITNCVPHAANSRYYAEIVKQKSIARGVVQAGTDLIRNGYSNLFTAAELLDQAYERFSTLSDAAGAIAPDGFEAGMISSSEMCEPVVQPDWRVKGVFVANEPTIFGGPQKTLKTSLLIDLAVSLGTACPFLGRFPVPRSVRVGMISGESGKFVIRANALEIARARGVDLDADGNIFWGFNLPKLTEDGHLRSLERLIRDNGLEVLMLDPLYLTIPSETVDHKNMFALGPVLATFGQICLDAGCTPILAHHFCKNREDPFGPPELHELAYGGISQWMRQWFLVSRRERYDKASGIHKLHLSFGGSFGHSAEYALDIETGVVDEDFTGRKWEVTLNTVSQSIATEEQDGLNRRIQRQAEADEATEFKTRKDMGQAIGIFEKQRDRKLTTSQLRQATSWNSTRAGHVLYRLQEAGAIRSADCVVATRGGGVRTVEGFELIE
jgi:replicative DNA helicase